MVEAFEIIQLIGICLAMIVGTIAFLVLLFRSMAWIDIWVKGRDDSDLKRVRRRRERTKQRTVPNEECLNAQPTTAIEVRKDIKYNGPVPRAKGKFARLLASAQQDLQSDAVVSPDEVGLAPKTVNRIATVHLLSGETMERVGFCSREKASKICEGLGFDGIVFENDDGQISVVRECNIKMVTWKAV